MVKSSKPASTTSSAVLKKKKSPRGVSSASLTSFKIKRGHNIKIVKDKDQCTYALGDIPCDGKLKCYLCDTYLIPHFNTYINCVKKTDNIWKKINYESKDGFYPQCEHIIPCASTLTPKPWYLNIMLYSIHNTMFKKYNIKTVGDISTLTSFNLLTSALTSDQKKLYFLKIIIRMNYAWAHSICNNTKNDYDFIEFESTTGLYKLFNTYINYVINTIFDNNDKYNKYIRNELRNHRKYPGALPDKITSKINSTNSTVKRLNFILYHLNNGHKFLGTPISDFVVTGGARRKRILGGTTNKDNLLLALGIFIEEKKRIIEVNNNLITSIDDDNDDRKILAKNQNINFTELIKEIQLTIELINNIEENDIFFNDCILYINNKLKNNNIDDFIDFNEYLENYLPDNINKYEKNIELFNHIKKIEQHPTYNLLEKFLLHILNKDDDIELDNSDYENDNGEINNEKIKSDYIKFFDFNSELTTTDIFYLKIKKFYLSEIFEETEPNTRLIILFLINHFKQIFIKNIHRDENKFYEICHMYFILDISYGLLYKDKDLLRREALIQKNLDDKKPKFNSI
jgi:hypothetical protein